MSVESNREEFVGLLRQTGRAGIESVIAALDKLGFFAAPASTRFHGAEPGGLMAHSLAVYRQAMAVRKVEIELCPSVEAKLPVDSVTLVALLHDVCKADIYRQVEKFRKDANNQWEKYLTYATDYSDFPMGHGEKSVIRLLQWGLQLTDDELLAIRWHMQAWDLADSYEAKGCFSAAGDKCPLLSVLIAADGLASRIQGI